MTTLTISLPETLQVYLQARANAEAQGDVSAYLQTLITADQKSRYREEVDAKLLVGVESLERREGRELTEADWEKLRQRISLQTGSMT